MALDQKSVYKASVILIPGDERAHRIKGRNPEVTVLNNYLDAKLAKLLQC